MNASRLATLLVGHAVRLRIAPTALALALVLATACSLGSVTQATKPQPAPRCADLVAHAFSSPNVPVAGAFACLSPDVQASFVAHGVPDDATFAQYAASDPVYTTYRYVGRSQMPTASPVRYYFELTPTRCLQLTVSNGLVDGGGFASDPGKPCPSPRP